jgi:hypothetical protein
MKKISWIVLICFFIAACKKERIEPEQYPFVFGATEVGYIICLNCRTTPIDFRLREFIEIDKEFNFFVRNAEGKRLFKGNLLKFKIHEKSGKIHSYSNYDKPLPNNIEYSKYSFDVEINSVYTNKYSKVVRNIKKINFIINPVVVTSLINGEYIQYIKDYNLIIGFESNISWGSEDISKEKHVQYEYKFKKRI